MRIPRYRGIFLREVPLFFKDRFGTEGNTSRVVDKGCKNFKRRLGEKVFGKHKV